MLKFRLGSHQQVFRDWSRHSRQRYPVMMLVSLAIAAVLQLSFSDGTCRVFWMSLILGTALFTLQFALAKVYCWHVAGALRRHRQRRRAS